MNDSRNWTVLFIGGASGTGKSNLAYGIARYYGVNVLEVDDVHLSVKTVASKADYPAIHYWDEGLDWREIGVKGNLSWLIDVSKELSPVLKALADRHIEDQLPVIIEGDFISPEWIASLKCPEVKGIFVQESDETQIVRNYLAREGGDPQQYRAEISHAYGYWLANACKRNSIGLVEARPWDTAITRAVRCLTQ